MGKKGGWFSAVRKVFNSSNDSKEKKEKKTQKTSSKKSWFGKQKNIESDSSQPESTFATPALRSPPPERDDDLKFAEPEAEPSGPTGPDDEPSKPNELEHEPNKPTKPDNDLSKPTKPEIEQKKPAHTMAFAIARATAAAAALRRFLGKSKEEVAATKVQARRKLRALKGLVRLKVLVQSQSVKRQAITTLRCMQTLARVQSQVRARRIRMSEENQALQRQLMQKRERELENMKSHLGNEWDNTRRSKQQIEASIQHKEEATARRERALTYAQTQQQMWRNPQSKSANPTFMDPNNPQWGWSWLDRWMAARPWESQTAIDNAHPPIKVNRSSSSGDMTKRLDQLPSTSSPRSPSVTSSRPTPTSPKSINDPAPSPHNRRHSISVSSFREDSTTPVSSPRVSSPRVNSPRSTKTKSMVPAPSQSQSPSRSPLGMKGNVGPAKKRLSSSAASGVGGPRAGSGTR